MSLPQLFEMYRGDDYALRVDFTDVEGNPVPITGWAFKSTMKLSTEIPDEEAEVQVDIEPVSGMYADNGILYIEYPSAQTKDLLPRTYYVDLQRILNGKVSTVMVGTANIKADVTKQLNIDTVQAQANEIVQNVNEQLPEFKFKVVIAD